MARQEQACWRCGTRWASEDGPRTALKVIPGGARPDAERWIDGGDSVVPEAVEPPAAAAA